MKRVHLMNFATSKTIVDEIVEFLISEPTLTEMAEFRASDALNERLHYLLDQNSNSRITGEERTELNDFLQLNHLMSQLKLKARLMSSKKATIFVQ